MGVTEEQGDATTPSTKSNFEPVVTYQLINLQLILYAHILTKDAARFKPATPL
jgi:hypothetical protein